LEQAGYVVRVSATGSAGYISGWGGDYVRVNDRFFEGGKQVPVSMNVADLFA